MNDTNDSISAEQLDAAVTDLAEWYVEEMRKVAADVQVAFKEKFEAILARAAAVPEHLQQASLTRMTEIIDDGMVAMSTVEEIDDDDDAEAA